jgi:hypothetical protein
MSQPRRFAIRSMCSASAPQATIVFVIPETAAGR